MRRYLLQDLVRVRQHREEQAGEAVARARRRLREAVETLAQAQKRLAEYTVWRVDEERRMLDELMRRALKLGELTDARQAIALLREREFEFVDQVKQAEAAVERAETMVEESRQKHVIAVRELEKLLEHRLQWNHEERSDAERTEEAELEDFSAPRQGPGREAVYHERN